MDTITHSHDQDQDHDNEVSTLSSYTIPLLDHPEPESTDAPATNRRRPISGIISILAAVVFLMSFIGIILYQGFPSAPPQPSPALLPENSIPMTEGRGVAQGVSQKSNGRVFDTDTYNWTDAMLDWQRSAYHFQPEQNWMNDPNGPLFHLGWYHLFYQYNPDSAVWGNITWGHAVSKDLIHWLYLPIAMVPDSWFDWNGVWTGSATLLPDGQIVMLYTGYTDNYVQVQNLANPANLSDPLLLDWVKYENNPVMVPPPGIALKDFRDPTTAWIGPDGAWRIVIGSKINTTGATTATGIALVYKTDDNFTSYELLDGVLHSVPTTGMWECIDLYPVAINGSTGLDTSVSGSGIKHVMKVSLDDDKHDYYAIGTYDLLKNTWTPDNPEEDVGIGLRVDYGKYYASKTFYDQNKLRRILLGWVGETDSDEDDLRKGWSSVQSIPRDIVYDNETGTNILQWPVEETESLRLNSTDFEDILLSPGLVVPLDIGSADQLDIIAEFVVDKDTLNATVAADVGGNCSAATERGALGPFGLLVIADDSLTELTPVYFYIAKVTDGSLQTFFCTDQTRSSQATSVGRLVYGGKVTVLDDETLSMRLLVDHSVVESFAQGGRTVITSRIYPTLAIYGSAKLFLFNNATDLNVTASLTVWQMDSAYIHPYPEDQI